MLLLDGAKMRVELLDGATIHSFIEDEQIFNSTVDDRELQSLWVLETHFGFDEVKPSRDELCRLYSSLFSQFDHDGSGSVDLEEFRSEMKKMLMAAANELGFLPVQMVLEEGSVLKIQNMLAPPAPSTAPPFLPLQLQEHQSLINPNNVALVGDGGGSTRSRKTTRVRRRGWWQRWRRAWGVDGAGTVDVAVKAKAEAGGALTTVEVVGDKAGEAAGASATEGLVDGAPVGPKHLADQVGRRRRRCPSVLPPRRYVRDRVGGFCSEDDLAEDVVSHGILGLRVKVETRMSSTADSLAETICLRMDRNLTVRALDLLAHQNHHRGSKMEGTAVARKRRMEGGVGAYCVPKGEEIGDIGEDGDATKEDVKVSSSTFLPNEEFPIVSDRFKTIFNI
ncbi:hypothetical protein Taro_006393 [Colocasia esculenta]|uniref:EF-hand domain-containing protein n=1 Tax=Colocasia esculenta TaxID=4460 RepID=A0A843TNL7_COLES|nr:hypothetical protein [Colocasia esculenta]